MAILIFPALVALAGVLVYMLPTGRAQALGLAAWAVGLFVVLLHAGGGAWKP